MQMGQRGFANEREAMRDCRLTKWCHPFIISQYLFIFKIFIIGGIDISGDFQAH